MGYLIRCVEAAVPAQCERLAGGTVATCPLPRSIRRTSHPFRDARAFLPFGPARRLPIPKRMSSYRYAIIGAGALGGFYGARLQRAGLDVHFLLHSDYAHVRENGLRIDSVEGDFTLPVQAYRQVTDMPPCDIVVLALKATANDVLSHVLPPVLSADGAVLVLQNGLGIEREVAGIVGANRVMGGLAFLCSHKVGPGHIHHLDYGAVTLADYRPDYVPAGVTERMKTIGSDFEQAGLECVLMEDLLLARWRKLVWNIPFNGLCTLHRTTTDRILAHPEWRRHAEGLMQEVLTGARACGKSIPESFIGKMLANTERMIPYRPSMLLDYEGGRPMEVEAIFGNPLRIAERTGARLPLLRRLYRDLKALDRRYTARTAGEDK